MRAQQYQNLIMIGVIVALMAGLGLAYWFGGNRGDAGASGPSTPIKKFRAKPGTERENARALVSSVPSVDEETTDRPIEIWGSLDPEDEPGEAYQRVQSSVAELTPEEAQDALRDQLAAGDEDLSGEDRAQLEAALAWALLHGDERDVEGAREAFARAFNACPDAESRVRLAFVYAELLYDDGEYEETLELLKSGRFVGAKFSPLRMTLEAIRGLALDTLGRDDDARAVYERVFESALNSDFKNSGRARESARLVALRLARQYRDDGRTNDAVAVSRRLRAWLEEEELVVR